jgi:collagen triple helix repeat protein
MSRLKHPIRSLKEPFGKAGLTVAVLALVLAMVGGAYAAGGLTNSQEKQVTKIAKKYAGKPGAAGAQGTPGAPGAPGKEGPQGKQGEAGKDGTNGTDGTTGFTETLPEGKTETGTWAFKEGGITAISFSIPLENGLTSTKTHFVTTTQATNHEVTECPGSLSAPIAEQGNLCVYEGFMLNAAVGFFFAGNTTTQGAATTGSILTFNVTATPGFGMGTWAVTAPE